VIEKKNLEPEATKDFETKKITTLPQAKVEAKVETKSTDVDDNAEAKATKEKLSKKLQNDEKEKANSRNMDKTDTWNIPVVDFEQEYDHIGYTRQALLNDID
jgi:hypothetical protein